MMKKVLSLIMLLAVTSLLFTACTKNSTANAPLIVAMELAYPPFETKDANGNPSGVSVDFAKDFGAYIGRTVEIQNTAWEGLIPSLVTGKADMVVSSMTITADRAKTVDFSIPYANAMLAVLTNKNSGINKIDDLNQAGKKVAVKIGSTGFTYAQKNLTNAELISLSDESACVTEVSQGKADGFIYDQLTIYRDWQANLGTTAAVFIPFQDVDQWGVAVNKGNTALLNQINDFITKYTKEGGFDKLTAKYLSNEKKAFDELGFKWFFDLN
ncbi:MAG: transporter substrate-binding domain-containing protein [Oscillospiraceae bacterium]|nr:transporter substrate-binding domain-containing protein [Oscillospiraceae bacterium]